MGGIHLTDRWSIGALSRIQLDVGDGNSVLVQLQTGKEFIRRILRSSLLLRFVEIMCDILKTMYST